VAPVGDTVTDAGAVDTDTTKAPSGTIGTSAPDSNASNASSGSATLTVGDQSWTFDNYYCLSGPDNTGNAAVSFSSGAFGEFDGGQIQLDASVVDLDEQGRFEGDGVVQSVSINDVEDFENPSVSLNAESGAFGTAEFVIQINGDTVTVTANFDDYTTDAEIETIPGTLEATCGTG